MLTPYIMQTFRQFLQFYFIGIALVFITALLFESKILTILRSPGLYILPAVFCIIGYVIGLLLFELNLRPFNKKKKIFLSGYSFSSLALLTVMIILGVKNAREKNHQKQFGNMEANHSVMKNWVNDNEDYIRIAFNRLEKEFKNPNDFILDAFSVRKRDTTINGSVDTVYNVYFVYFLNTDPVNKYFSKVSVLATKPELNIYNIDIRNSEEYQKIKKEKETQEQEMIKELNKAYKLLKDSLQKKD